MPTNPKIYHILHVDKLPSVISSNGLLSDAEVVRQGLGGTVIGMNSIKERRLNELTLGTYPDLYVGECVPFYFCPRSVMLYMMHMGNSPDLDYHKGQDDIIHLEYDLMDVVNWANANGMRWVFTDSNAGSRYFDDTNDITNINKLDWDAINARNWMNCRSEKQAEFLCETFVEWSLVQRIGVHTMETFQKVQNILTSSAHLPLLEIKDDWYY